tara:strand:+ start:184 stop:771 length:588 start_codon:yes stop_codon:yes gene_type:complete
MSLEGTNVTDLVSESGIYSSGLMKHNRFHVNLSIPALNNYTATNQAVFSVRIPGWDVTTTIEPGVGGNVKYFPYRKNWTQQLFITFYMENEVEGGLYDIMNRWCNAVVQPQGPQPYYNEVVSGNIIDVYNGDDPAGNIQWKFYEVYPKVLYPIELKPVEDFAPMVFSVQFGYRAYDVYAKNRLIATNNTDGGIGT